VQSTLIRAISVDLHHCLSTFQACWYLSICAHLRRIDTDWYVLLSTQGAWPHQEVYFFTFFLLTGLPPLLSALWDLRLASWNCGSTRDPCVSRFRDLVKDNYILERSSSLNPFGDPTINTYTRLLVLFSCMRSVHPLHIEISWMISHWRRFSSSHKAGVNLPFIVISRKKCTFTLSTGTNH